MSLICNNIIICTFIKNRRNVNIRIDFRKKIRIHVPEKVKHIHHYKKVFITQPTPLYTENNEAMQQYAPGFLGTESVPSLALAPLSERTESTVTPNLQPLYRARGHYGPTPVYRKPKQHQSKTRPSSSKRVKILTIEPRKKTYAKLKKTKRIIIRDEPRFKDNKDAGTSTSYQNNFYPGGRQKVNSFKKGRKPKRVEKFVDGDTEHIHTYSEEHIHQVVYDNPPEGGKPEGLEAAALVHGSVPFYSNSASLPPPHTLLPLDVAIHHAMHSPPMQPIIPMRHSNLPHGMQHPSVYPQSFGPANHHDSIQSMSHPIQTTIQVGSRPSDNLQGTAFPHHFEKMNLASFSSVGSLGTPAHMEYMNYNPREASHRHHYHDHGNANPNVGPNNNKFPPPHLTKANDVKENPVQTHSSKHHTSQSNKGSWVPQENANIGTELNENYHPFNGLNENHNKKHSDKEIIIASDLGFRELTTAGPSYSGLNQVKNEKRKNPKAKPISRIVTNNNAKKNTKSNQINLHPSIDTRPLSAPISLVEGVSYSGGRNNGFRELTDSSSHFHRNKKPHGVLSSELHRDSFTSDDYPNKENQPFSGHQRKKIPKKPISIQNINFGGTDHKSVVDHFGESSNISPIIHAGINDAAKRESPRDTQYSPEDHYDYRTINGYDAANHVPEASNTNIQIVEAPSLRTMQDTNRPEILETTSIDPNTTTNVLISINQTRRHRKNKKSVTFVNKHIQNSDKQTSIPQTSDSNDRGKFKYGDRLNERYDVEYEDLMFA